MPEQYYLQHWGIPKMQWGIRRYRNYDGTLTEEGKERYARRAERRAEAKAKIKNYFAEKRQRKKAKKEVAKLYGGGKSVSEMTNDELNRYIERLNLEKKYSELLSKTHPDKLHAAQEFVTSLAARFVTKAATASIDALVDKMYSKSKKDNDNNGGGKKKKKGNNNNNGDDDDWNPNQDLIDRKQRLGLESDVYKAKEKARESRYQYLEGERKRKEAERQRKEAEQDRKREWKRREQVARAQYKYRKKNGLSW